VCNYLLSDRIRKIEFDRSSGASQIARNALGVLRFFVETSKNETCSSFVKDFRELGVRLFEARPNMAPVQNLVAQTVYEVNASEESDLVSVRKFALSRIDSLCKQSEAAVKKSAEWAATIISDSDCLATCSHSSTICETFNVAKQQGKSFKVFVAESKSDNGKFRYGQNLAKFLKSIDVHAEVFPDNEIYMYVPKTKCVLVGADSVLFDGSVINGSPTYGVAVEAEDCGVPFYSVCETTKVNTLSYLGKNVEVKKSFDLIPSNLITRIVTEKGILDVKEIVEVMREKSKFFEIFHGV
jgi:translation initiation factor 2B subunit (eIF-2B alpha/beta/delta family)